MPPFEEEEEEVNEEEAVYVKFDIWVGMVRAVVAFATAICLE